MPDKVSLFPFPQRVGGSVIDGSIVPAPSACRDCHAPCVTSRSQELELCPFGYNYRRLDVDATMVGVVARDFAGTSQARAKRLREYGASAVPRQQIERAVTAYHSVGAAMRAEVEEEKARLVREYRSSTQYRTEFLSEVRNDIQRGLAVFHDYRQMNATILRNINLVIETRYKGASDFPEKVLTADPAERAIYEAAKFLDEKLNVAQFLMTPEWLQRKDECRSFSFSGLVTKLRQIYKGMAEQKRLRFRAIGESRLQILANPNAVSVIPHTLIDNALKYAPQESEIEIAINDRDAFIDFAVTSWGPFIKDSEEAHLFDLFFRGSGAMKLAENGTGYGLYVSQLVAKCHLGTEVRVDQHKSIMEKDRFKTTFSVSIPLRAVIL